MIRGLAGFVLTIASLVGLVVITLAWLFVSLPDVTLLKKCITTEMYHVHLCDKDAEFTSYERISPYIIGAVIMSEDASFYSHTGVDVEEMKESAIKDLNEGRFARGGSTITQQLAKNVFLTGSKNILRKVEEIYLALQIEKHFSKQRILTLYLNVVEFGENIYGVKQACRFYFNRQPSDVTPEQAAFLAFLLPNPKKYSQSFSHRQLTPFAYKMVRTILHKMDLGHKISDDQYREAEARVAVFPWRDTPASALGATGSTGAGAAGVIGGPEQDEAAILPDHETPQIRKGPGGAPTSEDMVESPMGTAPRDRDARGLLPGASDESNQSDDDFKFDFNPDEEK